MDIPISSMMTSQTRTVAVDDSVAKVEQLLNSHQLSALPVTEGQDKAIVGMISTRDLMRFHAAKRDPDAVRAWEICSYKPVQVSPDTTISEVAKLMLDKQLHHILVTKNNEVLGIVSSFDFVKKYVQD
jgi:CBS domain-containing protein